MRHIVGGVILSVLIGLIARSSRYVVKGTLTYYVFVPTAGVFVWVVMHRLLARP